MKIKNILSKKRTLSFEIFPPKKEGEFESLVMTISQLRKYQPDWISVTYGAGGSTKEKSVDVASVVKTFFNTEVLAHLTCVNSKREEIKEILNELKRRGIENILALRGDPPIGNRFEPGQSDFNYASDLVSFVRKNNGFCIGGACYPQGHLESLSLDEDIENLKKKVDAGTDFLITQLFFENSKFYDFVEKAKKAGINIPIIPGIMPITNYHQIRRMTELSGQEIPKVLKDRLESVADQPEEVEKRGRNYAATQVADLINNGVAGVHFYCMNKSKIVSNILDWIGYK